MDTIIDRIRNTPRNTLILQIALFLIGIIASVVFVILGLLQESVFEVFESPLIGILFQVYSFILIELNPMMILLIGSLGFVVFFVIPGILITYWLIQEVDLLSRILFGTGISIIVMFFPLFYLLLFGIAPHWLILFIPLILSIIIVTQRPDILQRFTNDSNDAFRWLISDIQERKNTWFWVVVIFIILTRISFFSLTDSYWTDSVTYVSYGEAIANGTLLTGVTFSNPIGFPVVVYP